MNSDFDPYRKWLGIPPKDQPPNHYRLLGIELFESDPDVISNAADARMAHIRTFQTGPYSEWSQKLLNEIAAAKLCLLNPEKKAEYDARLRAQLGAQAQWAPPAVSPAALTGTAEVSGSSPVARQSSFPYSQPIPLQSGPPQQAWPAETAAGSEELIPGGLGQGLGSSTARLLAYRRKAWQGPALVVIGAAAVFLVALAFWMMQEAFLGPEVAGQPGGSKLPIGQEHQKGEKLPVSPHKGGTEAKTSTHKSPKSFPPAGSLPQATATASAGGGSDSSAKQPPASSGSLPEGSEKPPAEASPSPSTPSAGGEASEKPGPRKEKGAGPPKGTPEGSATSPPETTEESSEAETPDKPLPKHPVPSEAEQTKAAEEIRQLLKEEFAAAEKTGAAKALSQKLLQSAQQTTDQPAAQYLLFQMAAEWAARAADASLLDQALSGLTQRFQVERRPLLIGVLEKAAAAPGEENLLPARLELIQETVEELLAEDEYLAADRLAKAALAMSRKTKDTDFQRQAAAWAGKIDRLAQQYAKLREQLDKLAQDPTDPEANLAVGRWYAVQTAQWEKALAYLAKSNHSELAEAAGWDLKSPQEPNEQQKLADLWWQLSEKASGEERQALQARAVYWYEQALPHLSGLSKTSVQRRIETFQASLPQKESSRITQAEYVLYFDGQKTYATVPNFQYDGTKPLTVEVILKAESAKQDGAIIGNLTPMGGWRLALAKHPNRTGSEPYWVFFFYGRALRSTYSEEPAQIGQRVMLAAVYDRSDIRIFVNGRRQDTAHPILWHRPGSPTLLIGASSSPTSARANFFHGSMEQVRISFVVRYTSNFTPPERLEKDKDTELLLDFTTNQGPSVRDLSGARRAARIVAGKWVKRDASNP